jgi:hypothetical protein
VRDDDLRALARPPFAPAVRTDIVPRPLVRDDDFDVPDLRAVARPPFLPAAFFCAVVPARPPFAPAWRTVGVRRLVVFRADVVFRAGLVFRAVVFFRVEAVLRPVDLRAVVFLRDELPPERDDEPPERDEDDRDDDEDDFEDDPDFVSPDCARCLLTVRAAISFARFVERPCFCSDSLTCSY